MRTKKRWNSGELETLTRYYSNTPSREIAQMLHRTPKSVRTKAKSLGLSATERNWSFPRPIQHFEASAELAYLIGAIKGDGSVSKSKYHQYWITLSVTDYDFADAVKEAMFKITGKNSTINRIHQSSPLHGSDLWRVQKSNKSLYSILSRPLGELVSYAESYPQDFLRGLFDAEGSAWFNHRKEPVVKISNTDIELILLAKSLLNSLGILESPKIVKELFVFIDGKKAKRPKPLYNILIQSQNGVKKFMETIVSTIPRKRLEFNV